MAMASLARSLIFSIGAGVVGYAVGSLLRQKEGDSRPLAKSAIRAGLIMFQQARQTVGEFTEATSDLLAEAQAELEEEREHNARPGERRGEQIFPFAMRTPETERKAHG
jgi:hypothetical protein